MLSSREKLLNSACSILTVCCLKIIRSVTLKRSITNDRALTLRGLNRTIRRSNDDDNITTLRRKTFAGRGDGGRKSGGDRETHGKDRAPRRGRRIVGNSRTRNPPFSLRRAQNKRDNSLARLSRRSHFTALSRMSSSSSSSSSSFLAASLPPPPTIRAIRLCDTSM